jgi:hypothetical protein
MHFARNFLRFLTLSACCFASTATTLWGCPNCKEGLLENGRAGTGLARGFELSIYLMLGAPLLILSTLAIIFYIQIRSAKRNGSYPDLARIIAQAEASSLPPSPM